MIRVFPRRTKWTPCDDLAFVGFPPLFRPPMQPVAVSVTFTWDIPIAKQIREAWLDYYPVVMIGGPALGHPGGEFVPGRFIKEGVTITSRGCVKSCPWCFVPKREGRIRELIIMPGWIVQDNNLLACSRKHIEKVFEMLRRRDRGITFSGGLDATLLEDWHRTLLDSIKLHEIWVACDRLSALPVLERASKILDGIPVAKRRCYAMVGFDAEQISDAEKRLERIYELGFLPFCQLFRSGEKTQWSKQWRDLAKKWSRPAAYRSKKQDP